jgi:hypothetical protein
MNFNKQEIESEIKSNNIDLATNKLLDICFNSEDWKWVQDICISLIKNKTVKEDLRRLAITCIGHLARIHSMIEKDKVLPFLEKVKKENENLAGTIDDTLDDISMFVI